MSNVNINDLILGEIVVPSFSEANQEVARDCAQHLGIDQMLNMPRCGYRNVLIKAIKKVNRSNKEYSIELVHEGPSKVQYVIVRKEVRDNGRDHDGNEIRDPNLGVESRFYFSKENRDKGQPAEQCINFWENEYHPIAMQVRQEYYSQAVVFSADDMRRSTNNMLIAIGSIQVTRGNVWFVPKQQKDLVLKLQEWLNWNNCRMDRYTQLDVDNTKSALQDACQDGLTSKMQELRDSIQAAKADNKTRNTTMEKRIRDLENLRSTIDLYNRAIGMDFAEMQAEIEQCEKDLVSFMLGRPE